MPVQRYGGSWWFSLEELNAEIIIAQQKNNALYREVVDWGNETFPDATTSSILAHLSREVIELLEDQTPEEAADVCMLLMHYADKAGFNLFEAVRKKFEINKTRKWGAPDENGVIEHIRE